MKRFSGLLFSILVLSTLVSNGAEPLIKPAIPALYGQEVTYELDGVVMKGYAIYNATLTGPLPVVLVVPEWWGNNDYARQRATMLAQQGYFAFAVDMYGDGKIAETPQQAQEFSSVLYKNPALALSRLKAALKRAGEFPQADITKVAAIGYCFGGSMVLNAAKMGMDLKGVVSFHGGLAGVPATKGSVKGKILVCHGGADTFVPEADIVKFRKNLDTEKVAYTFTVYPDATHAFTNPEATEIGTKFNMPIRYNPEADSKSWDEMLAFLKGLF
ncbi:dienelactone hydrolase family protein [Williamwhitmania taraxaci]|uniref:Dienelactone hydrolase n=1 Tax=Williamwhitmania taraxaci TaxID=1640674 RepID=A0A1G6K102_9BACT|nr:dienelactone hydrolase family protein [Williamwhitmania taraxaci]SDC24680.1 Dienelactone hydrolase [Williamwhitmania taraxaci]